MKLFVFEYITSGALIAQQLPPSLAHEGDLMLQALLQDFTSLNEIDISIMRDARLDDVSAKSLAHPISCIKVESSEQFDLAYQQGLAWADAVLPVAPENDAILAQIQQDVIDSNAFLMGCAPSTSRLCGDKYQTFLRLQQQQIPTPNTILATDWNSWEKTEDTPYIIKPIDGAGCEHTFKFDNAISVDNWLANHQHERFIIQPYIAGTSLSLTLLCYQEDCHVLTINQQHIIQNEDKLVFTGCSLNHIAAKINVIQAQQLATQLASSLPELWGIIGVDLIVSDDDWLIVDINPRITTSYLGLTTALNYNPATMLLDMIHNKHLPDTSHCKHRPVEVRL